MKNECFGCKPHSDKIGVLIAQLGTPDSATDTDVRPYLKRFLGDPRVIEKPRWLWWLILNGLILRTRPARSAKLYQRIWTDEGSPLLVITRRQTELVRNRLAAAHPSIEVEFGMRYSKPFLPDALESLIAKGCSKILLFNMYPQYSATTTASNYDAIFPVLLRRRVIPTLRVAEPFFAHPEYIRALAATINESLASLPHQPERVVFSYHGIPEEYVAKGDVYCCQCTETTRALVPELAITPGKVIHTYQSRFGKDPWLEPYTDETFERLAKQGIQRIAVAAPGFTADCLETLDELGHEGREQFTTAGGKEFYLIPCLNDHPVWIEAMSNLILEELGSWLTTAERTTKAYSRIACPVKVFKKTANG